MSNLNQFLEDLGRVPDDWKLRGGIADWAEDNNQAELAAGLRWVVRQQKRPYHGAAGGATWFNAETVAEGLGDPESDIPQAVYKLLDEGREGANQKAFLSLR